MAALNITSPDYFMLDGVSSATVGLYVDTPPIPPLAKQRYTTWATGVDMDNSSPDDVWENITLSFKCYVFKQNDSFDMSPIYAFVRGKSTLQYSRFANRFFRIKQIGGITPTQQHDGNKIALTISFVCSPFKYHTSNTEFTPENNVITNPGTRYSRPIYKISPVSAGGSVLVQTGSIAVNGQVLTVDFTSTFVPHTIVIDAERMIAYENSTHENWTRFTTGLFPFLSPGENGITCTDCAVSVIGNWRDY